MDWYIFCQYTSRTIYNRCRKFTWFEISQPQVYNNIINILTLWCSSVSNAVCNRCTACNFIPTVFILISDQFILDRIWDIFKFNKIVNLNYSKGPTLTKRFASKHRQFVCVFRQFTVSLVHFPVLCVDCLALCMSTHIYIYIRTQRVWVEYGNVRSSVYLTSLPNSSHKSLRNRSSSDVSICPFPEAKTKRDLFSIHVCICTKPWKCRPYIHDVYTRGRHRNSVQTFAATFRTYLVLHLPSLSYRLNSLTNSAELRILFPINCFTIDMIFFGFFWIGCVLCRSRRSLLNCTHSSHRTWI